MAGRLILSFLAFSFALAAPAWDGGCSNPKQRRPWHTFSEGEKQAYIDAELCLMHKPATLNLRGARTKFDELQSCHVLQAEVIHHVGAFLPFHRMLIWAHEKQLENECGYQGDQPYWQEQLDAGNFIDSPVLWSKLGFGGDGVGPDNCVADGPFASYQNSMGPGYEIGPHCINRKIDESSSMLVSQFIVGDCLRQDNFIEMWNCIEARPHFGGHGGVGGEMFNAISSPGDPLFYLHHTWLDKLWWDWQKQDLPYRLTEIGGRNRITRNPDGTFVGGVFSSRHPSDVPEPAVEGDPGGETTLDHVLNMWGVVDNKRIRDVMNIYGDLCYEYV